MTHQIYRIHVSLRDVLAALGIDLGDERVKFLVRLEEAGPISMDTLLNGVMMPAKVSMEVEVDQGKSG